MQAVIHPPWHFVSCALHISYISTVTVYSMSYSFPNFETLHCSMSSFLTCIQVSQETGKVAWYSHFLKNFPQFSVIHTVKDFIIVNEAELDVFWKSTPGPTIFFFFFFDDPMDVGNLFSGFSAFYKYSLYIWKFSVHVLLKPSLKDFEHKFGSK